jgi:hypothetical protein
MTNHRTGISLILTLCVGLVGAVGVVGCASDPYAGKGAAEGAKTGAVYGAVAGAVGSLLWGGNPVEGAVKGGAASAAGGAAVGAMQGSGRDTQIKQQIGESNYRAVLYLADCLHDKAREQLGAGYASDNPRYVTAAYWIDAVVAEDQRDGATLKEKVNAIVEHDPDYSDPDDVRIEVKMLEQKLQNVRKELGKPVRCP